VLDKTEMLLSRFAYKSGIKFAAQHVLKISNDKQTIYSIERISRTLRLNYQGSFSIIIAAWPYSNFSLADGSTLNDLGPD
jgi:hypothetical protein